MITHNADYDAFLESVRRPIVLRRRRAQLLRHVRAVGYWRLLITGFLAAALAFALANPIA